MDAITREELREKIERGDDFRLVMVLGEWAFRAKHIRGSLSVTSPEQGLELLRPEDEIVVYCSDDACPASRYAHYLLTRHGYPNVRRYAGGLADWEDGGLPLEGERVTESAAG